MRKLHDIHSTSMRARKNNQNTMNSNSDGTTFTHSSQSQTSIQLSPSSSSSTTHHIVNLNHHPFSSLQQHQREYTGSFMVPSARQRLESAPFIAKVF
jgi:hypothetical protein